MKNINVHIRIIQALKKSVLTYFIGFALLAVSVSGVWYFNNQQKDPVELFHAQLKKISLHNTCSSIQELLEILITVKKALVSQPQLKDHSCNGIQSWGDSLFNPTWAILKKLVTANVSALSVIEKDKVRVQVAAICDEFDKNDNPYFNADLYHLASAWKKEMYQLLHSSKGTSLIAKKDTVSAYQTPSFVVPGAAYKSPNRVACSAEKNTGVDAVRSDQSGNTTQTSENHVSDTYAGHSPFYTESDDYGYDAYTPQFGSAFSDSPNSTGLSSKDAVLNNNLRGDDEAKNNQSNGKPSVGVPVVHNTASHLSQQSEPVFYPEQFNDSASFSGTDHDKSKNENREIMHELAMAKASEKMVAEILRVTREEVESDLADYLN